ASVRRRAGGRDAFRCLTTTDDLARWESCGIPSTWRSPTTRHPGGSPRRNRYLACLALPPGCRVVALGGGRRDATPCPHPPVPPALVAGHPGDLPARRGHVLVGDVPLADVALLGERCSGP